MVMSLIESLTRIKNAVYGREVREAIHDGVFRANQIADGADAKADKTQIRQDAVEDFNNQVIQEMTDKDVISAPEIIEARGGKPNLKARLDNSDSKILQNVEYIELSKLGLDGDGISNLNKILNKLTKNNIYFVVDGDYTLASDGIRDLVYDFNMVSFNNGSITFNSESSETFFNLKASVRFKNVKFKNITQLPKILFSSQSNNNSEFEEFRVENCDFEGTIRLADLSTCKRIKSISINGNSIKNTTISFFQASVFIMDHVEIKSNYVENWLYRVFTIDSMDNIDYVEIDGNYATNTDDWIFSDTVPFGTYYVFALVKAKKIRYSNNTVSNMKASSDVSLYDIYAFADEYIYENNIYENNVCYYPGYVGMLMKCKNEGSIKHFKNNRFTIDDGFLDDLGVDSTTFKVKLYDIWGGRIETGEVHTMPVSFYMSGNTIEVPNLALETGYRLVQNFYFENNTIHTNILSDTMVLSNQSGATMVVRNNNIQCSSESSYVFFRGKSDEKYNKLVFENNNIQNWLYVSAEGEFDKGQINNNTFYKQNSAGSRLITYNTFSLLSAVGNVFLGEALSSDLSNIHILNQMIHKSTGGIISNTIYLDKIVGTKTIEIMVKQFDKHDIYSIGVGGGKVTFTDESDAPRTVNIGTSEAHGVSLKNLGNGATTLKFHNSATYTTLDLDTNTTKVVDISYIIS